MNKKYLKVSLVINIIIALLTVFSSAIMFSGYKFMDGEVILESSRIGMLKFFTVDSNILMGIISIIFSLKEISILKGKENDISKGLYILKLMATSSVTLTFLTVFGYLQFIVNGGVIMLLKNSNLFFHLIIPVLSIIVFIFFEKNNKLKFKDTFLGSLPTLIYAIIYLVNALVHVENGKVSPNYDWYYFVHGGIYQAIIVFPLMLFVSYIISLILWKINNKK